MEFKSEFLKTIAARGFIHQQTDSHYLDNLLSRPTPVAAYCGFDCTAPSLHVGSLLQIMLLRAYQQAGHKPIILMGGATTKVGDPSFRDESRKLLGDAEIAVNMQGIKKAFEPFIRFGDGPNDAVMVNNADWLDGIHYMGFLRDYGRHFSVQRMLSFDSVKLRMEREQSLSFLEFNYMILQAYDFVELNKRHACRLQFGGSDQWGNIVNGVELQRRITAQGTQEADDLFGLTTPLITASSGAKMGKTAKGAVWLNGDLCSPYDYWQFWRNTEDGDVGRFLKFFTELSLSEISELEKLQGSEINEAKKILANEATRLCHGEEAARMAEMTARKTFEEGVLGDSLPEIKIARERLAEGIAAYELFKEAGLASSGGEARKLIRGNGAKLNDTAVTDENLRIGLADISAEGFIKLSAGKKRHVKISAE